MKIAGRSLVKRRHEPVTIERDGDDGGPLELIVCSAQPGLMTRMRLYGLLDYPKPPIQFKTKPGSTDLQLDAARNPIEIELTDDPVYQAKVTEINLRIRAIKLRSHLADDSSVEWEAVEPADDDREKWKTYADALCREIEQFGLTDEEIAEILRRGSMLNNGIDMKAALDSF